MDNLNEINLPTPVSFFNWNRNGGSPSLQTKIYPFTYSFLYDNSKSADVCPYPLPGSNETHINNNPIINFISITH